MKFKSTLLLVLVLIFGFNAYGQKSKKAQTQKTVAKPSSKIKSSTQSENRSELLRKIVADNSEVCSENMYKDSYGDNWAGKLAQSWRFQSLDLNRDGLQDFIIYPTDSCNCGTGGCSLFIYQKTKTGWMRLSNEEGWLIPQNSQIVAEKTSSDGFLDLRIVDARKRFTSKLRFDGTGYTMQ